jgi:transcriptional regulator with XRE-family HTH domain
MEPHVLAEQVASQFKKYRERAGMTQAAVAVKAGTTVETVARLERVPRGRESANANPTLETLARLAYAVGVDPVALLKVSGVMPMHDRLEAALQRASQPVRNTLAVLAEALVTDECHLRSAWAYHAPQPLPGSVKKRAKKKPRKH